MNLRYQIVLLFSVLFSTLNGQVVVTDPNYPVADGPVTITFDPSLCDCSLLGYTDDLYVHTGVTIEGVGTWEHVIGLWGNNPTQPQLTYDGPSGNYILTIPTSINDFYSVPVSETVTQICIVFRSADATKQSADIFIDVFKGTDITFLTPDTTNIYSPGLINISAVSLNADEISLYVNEIHQSTVTTADEINFDYDAVSSGTYNVRVAATHGVTIIEKETSFYVKGDNVIEDLPSGDLIDGINYISDTEVTLVLYAPNKEYVFIKGSFDNWGLSESNHMKQTTDGDRYWVTLTNLVAEKEYIYQYIVDGTIIIADPYAEKVLDPWNDHYISSDTYPGLIQYPQDKTSEIVSVFQTGQTGYNWQITDFNKPDKENLVIYELLIRDFAEQSNYQTLIDTIAYFKRLGINAIELMPVNEFDGNISWGYNPSFYFAPDKAYGSKQKLKEFIDVCHQNGIAVILDVVLNHTFGQSPFVKLYFDPNAGSWGQPSAENPWYNQTATHPYSVGYDLNHESVETQLLSKRVMKFWMEEYKIDGFRFDLSKGFTQTYSGSDVGLWGQYDQSRIDIWKMYYDYMVSIDPDIYVILEHFADNSEEIALSDYGMMLWGNLNYNYMEASMGWLSTSNFSGVSYLDRSWNNPNLVGYMESHDEERLMYKTMEYGNSNDPYNIKDTITALERAELCAAFFFTIPGPKMIWQFGELGYHFSKFYDINTGTVVDGDDGIKVDPKPIRWDFYENEDRFNLFRYYSALIKLKNNNDVFNTVDFDISLSGAIKEIVLRHSSMNVVIIGNFDVEIQNADPDLSSSDIWYDYYTQAEYSADTNFDLKPGDYKILTDKKLELPDIPQPEEGILPADLFVYPNPVTDYFTIADQNRFDIITVSDIQGKIVLQFEPNGTHPIDISFLRPGLYIIKAENINESQVNKFVKL